jgi:hypothetical protein
MTGAIYRWPIASLAKDETLQSLTERAARFYECSPERLWAATNDDDVSVGAPDDPTAPALARLAHAVGMRPIDLLPARIPDGPGWLTPTARHAYCPYCWQEDLQAGRPCHYRVHWARVLTVACHEHGSPLLYWRPHRDDDDAGYVSQELSVCIMALESLAADAAYKEALSAIYRFAADLDGALFGGKPRPRKWIAPAGQIRRLMERVLVEEDVRGAPWSMTIPHRWRGVVHLGRHAVIASGDEAFEPLRHAHDPGMRRAALWLAASQFDPGCPEAMRPPTSDVA